jgi:hypothetical protein
MTRLLRRLFGCPHSTRREYHAGRLTLICDDCGRRWPVDVTDAEVAARLEARRQQAREELREATTRQRIRREREAWRAQSVVTPIASRRRLP